MKTDVVEYCGYDSCDNACGCGKACQHPILVDRTYADTIKVVLPDGYTQKFWVDITDHEAINRCYKMKEEGIK